ncbi:UDP-GLYCOSYLTRANSFERASE 72E1 [Salix viminalis]|uniref:UDP-GLYCOSYLTRANSFERASE 72E1 n=1 Tax=Salix viminalis TaxID=40686 RepID=A0A9Q0NYX9_SALVM|nr:UDP-GLYCOSYLTRANSFERASE 72E1 [Salix viminalis]
MVINDEYLNLTSQPPAWDISSPVLELGKRLLTCHGFHVTLFVVATDASTTQSLLQEPHPNLSVVNLPLVDISGLVDPTATIVTKIIVMMRETLPSLRSAILALKFPPTALIVDLFGTEAFAVAEELNMLKYVFDTSTAWFLAITIYVPTIDKSVEDEHVNQKQPLRIPGCKSVPFDDTLGAYLDRNDQTYVEYKRIGIEMPMADGILMNTWDDLEPATIGALRDFQMLGRVAKVPVYPIGPLARPAGSSLPRNHKAKAQGA